MIAKKETRVAGCYELIPDIFRDMRGAFIKTFHKAWFRTLGLPVEYGEEYTSRSRKGVLRGLHFQLPPEAHGKLIYCSEGAVLDVAVDLRRGPGYGTYAMTKLVAERGTMAYVPVGCAHGFYTLSEEAVIVCKQTRCFAPELDRGIRWDSAGIPWPDMHPILSEKDQHLMPLADFQSPFVMPDTTGKREDEVQDGCCKKARDRRQKCGRQTYAGGVQWKRRKRLQILP